MSSSITLQTEKPELFRNMLLSRKMVAAHMHSMHPANRPNRPAALGPLRADDAQAQGEAASRRPNDENAPR